MSKFIAFDCEFAWRADWYHAHQTMDRTTNRRAVAVKEITAISAYSFSFDEEGRLTIDVLASWNQHDWGCEADVLAQFLDFVRRRPDHALVGYGSLGTDLPVLVMAAMTGGLDLPAQLRDFGGRWDKKHVDLGLLIKGRGKTWTHLAQLAIRIGVPLELVAAKAEVPLPQRPDDWIAMADHVELDALLLALVWSAWLAAQGQSGVQFAPAAISHIDSFRRRRPEHRLAKELATYQATLEEAVADRYRIAA